MENPAFTLAVVLDPLLDAQVPIDVHRGLNVLYGRNGAGKTRLLTGLRNALEGVRGTTGVGLLVRADRSQHDTDGEAYGLHRSITTMLARSVASPADFVHYRPGMPLADHRLPPLRASQILDEYLLDRLPDSGPARDWVLENRLFLMIPVGTPGSPAWEAWPVAEPGLDWVRAEEEFLQAEFERYDADYVFDDDEDLDPELQAAVEGRYVDAVEGAVLFPEANRELYPSTMLGGIWHLGPYSPIGYGYRSTAQLDSIVVTGAVDFGLDLIDYDRPIAEATAASLAAAADIPTKGFGLLERPGKKVVERALAARAEALGRDVTARLRRVLLDAPSAELQLSRPAERLFKEPFTWTFRRDSGGWRQVPFGGLSRAERLWAERAIHEAIWAASDRDEDGDDEPPRARLHIYDEPEAALHRSAEAQMARALVEMARDPRAVVVAATHSPELLDATTANVIEVRRGVPSSVVHRLDDVSRHSLNDLGLNPSDLLRLTRVFLLVEGLHDEVLVERFLGARLREARVDVIPIRGGGRLASTADSRVLFDYTDAHVVALLDNTDARRVADVWERSVEAAATGDLAEAKQIVTDEIGYRDGESQYLTSWLTRALDYGLASRLSPAGLEAADIIEYLPVERVVPTATSWDELHDRHREERETRSGTPKGFKEWLSARYRVSFNRDSLLEYAAGLPVPRDFERLMKTLEAISADR